MNKREISINRIKQNINRARAIEIYINNKIVGTIRNGETKIFKVDSDITIVYAKIDWCITKPKNINTPENKMIILELGSNLSGWKLLLAIYYVIFKPSKYLYLRVKKTAAGFKPCKS
ncbi:MAG: hypothetical protein WA775_03325 [Psychroserpens sp.]|uniref:hypothetical protein n=1 Tax=Psychroserpens sp. TaxID=2020870 RepID=UPI003C86E178